jgi:hypothetical protein
MELIAHNINAREVDHVYPSHYRQVVTIMSERIPNFHSHLNKFKKQPEALQDLCRQVRGRL